MGKKDQQNKETEEEFELVDQESSQGSSQQGDDPDLNDPDVRELMEAEKALKGEGRTAEEDDGQDGAEVLEGQMQEQEGSTASNDGSQQSQDPQDGNEGQDGQAAQGGSEGQSEDGQQGQNRYIPYERFSEVNQKAREAENRATYLEGVVEALRSGQTQQAGSGQQGQQQAPAQQQPQPPQDPRVVEHQANQQVAQAAEKFDRGEITLSQFKSIENQAQNASRQAYGQYRAYQEQQRRQQAQQQQPSQQRQRDPLANASYSDQKVIDEQAQRLTQEHPHLNEMGPEHFDALKKMAYQEAEMQGQPYGASVADTIRLRDHVAELSDVFYPKWFPDKAGQQQSQQNGQGSRGGNGNLSPQAQARADKMQIEASQPPNTNQMGASKVDKQFSEADVENMSDDEIAELPDEALNRIMRGP